MTRLAATVLCLLMAGCAGTPEQRFSTPAFHDEMFAAPSERIDAGEVFALSPQMQHYIERDLADALRSKGTQRGLVDALYTKGQLKLTYDSSTRNAAETFAARSGNCLSLVVMTAAFAKAIGLSVNYQAVAIEETWSRTGGMYFRLGHVNLSLGGGRTSLRDGRTDNTMVTTIDFLPPDDLGGRRTYELSEQRIVAMYMNNRAAEALSKGRVDDAYWWARAAIGKDPQFLSTYNTLGVVYRHHANAREAEDLFTEVLRHEPSNRQAMSNLVLVLKDQGRQSEAAAILSRLEKLEPDPPFAYFERGLAALRARNYAMARDLFEKEVDRTGDYHEFHFWLAVAYVNLGETAKAREQLALAIRYSDNAKNTEVYSGKLARLNASASH